MAMVIYSTFFAFLLHIRVNKFNLANMNIRFLIIHSLSFSYITKTYYSLFCRWDHNNNHKCWWLLQSSPVTNLNTITHVTNTRMHRHICIHTKSKNKLEYLFCGYIIANVLLQKLLFSDYKLRQFNIS